MNKDRTESKYLTISLTNAPPVRIETERWPVIASAEKLFDDCAWSLIARQHEDCRAIVYGINYFCSDDPDYCGRQAGKLLPPVDPMEEQDRLIASTIAKVGKSLDFADDFIQQCIATMTPEEI